MLLLHGPFPCSLRGTAPGITCPQDPHALLIVATLACSFVGATRVAAAVAAAAVAPAAAAASPAAATLAAVPVAKLTAGCLCTCLAAIGAGAAGEVWQVLHILEEGRIARNNGTYAAPAQVLRRCQHSRLRPPTECTSHYAVHC